MSDQFDADASVTHGDEIDIGTGYYSWTTTNPPTDVRLVWISSDGDEKATISVWQGQDEPDG